MKKQHILLALVLMGLNSCLTEPKNSILVVGKYNENGEKGIEVFSLDETSGVLKKLADADAGPNPSYFCISKKHGILYAANEVMNFKGGQGGGITSLKMDVLNLEKLNEFAIPNGSPCFISLSPAQDYLFLANYTGGSIAVVKLDDKGIPASISDTVSFMPIDEKNSHAHMISFSPGGEFVYLTDLGLDRIMVFNFDSSTGKLQEFENSTVNQTPGAGPRHFVFNADASMMYVINELNSSISVFEADTSGHLKGVQEVSTLADGYPEKSFCADIKIGKDGKYLYGSNRGENTIVCFKIEKDGKLNLSGRVNCGGDWPRNFTFDPSGKFLFVGNQRSGNVSVFKLDDKTGVPIETGNSVEISSPSCLKFFVEMR